MSKEKIYKYQNALNRNDLIKYILEQKKFEKEELNFEIDLNKLQNELSKKIRTKSDSKRKNFWDLELVEIVHSTFETLPRRITTDLGFLQWLSIERFQDYTWQRWISPLQIEKFNGIPKTPGDKISVLNETGNEGLSLRFLGSNSTKGLASRHTFGRMIFSGELLKDKNTNNYDLAKKLYHGQNLSVAMFERNFGINERLAKSLVKYLYNEKKEKIIFYLKKLNHYASTMSVENIEHDQIDQLLNL